ncbi:helix-turn-helix domain-containing protein [Nocardiopsis sp. FR6]|uniref:helix-turn-helix domain-containing protein n=1 Tax=Nocardiopsis sp. FR6 TaxID=2605986 RepID=UPI00135AB447|nr:helix-turn-helix transcriptional regulator [Nocardiopsis sp. FR6]
MIDDRGPVVHQALLTDRLVRLRQSRGLTQEQVAGSLDWSVSKVIRYEKGQQVISKVSLNALLDLYKVARTREGEELVRLGEGARQKAWWSDFRRVMKPDYTRYVGLEAGASSILQFQATVVPGLLQTHEYARAVTKAVVHGSDADLIVDVRRRRRRHIEERAVRPKQTYVLDEAVIRRHVGVREDPNIMPLQLWALVHAARSPHVDIRIIPFGVGEHFGFRGSFTILKFDGVLGEILYTESDGRCVVSDKEYRVRRHRERVEDLISNNTLGSEESVSMIESVAIEMKVS